MRYLNSLWLATVTRNDVDAGTRNLLVLTVHVNGGDVLKCPFPANTANDQARGRADLYLLDRERIRGLNTDPIPEDKLCKAEFRLGIDGTDTWRPEHVFIWGEVVEEDDTTAACPQVLPLAGETDMDVRISLDQSKGQTWKAISTVRAGGPDDEIRRLLVLMTTKRAYNGGWIFWDYLTNSIWMKVGSGSGQVVFNQPFPRTSQHYFQTGQDNCFIRHFVPSMQKSQIMNDSVTIEIDGSEEWHPGNFFIFGLDTLKETPALMVPLVYLPEWTFGCLSQNTGNGRPWAVLPLV